MKTHEEIKKGLEIAVNGCMTCECCITDCPYDLECHPMNEDTNVDMPKQMAADALAYIRKLENQIGELIEKVEQLEATHPKWISVNDMLPEKDGKYIVCTAKGSVYCTRFKAYGKSGSFQTDINTHITHWMLLPEPPKEDA